MPEIQNSLKIFICSCEGWIS